MSCDGNSAMTPPTMHERFPAAKHLDDIIYSWLGLIVQVIGVLTLGKYYPQWEMTYETTMRKKLVWFEYQQKSDVPTRRL